MNYSPSKKMAELCLDPELLFHTTMATDIMDTVIKDIDDQLYQNTKQLEECVKELWQEAHHVQPSRKFATPMEACDALFEDRLLDKKTCYDTDTKAVTRLLRFVVSVLPLLVSSCNHEVPLNTLDKQPGCEEDMLRNLLHFSCHEGISLPIKPSSSVDTQSQSVMSVNAVCDQAEQVNETLWNDICARFRKYYFGQLMRLPIGIEHAKIDVSGFKRVEYLQSLCSLIPSEEVWGRYRNTRLLQVESCLCGASDQRDDSLPFKALVAQFDMMLPKLLVMLREDFELLNSGIFSSSVDTLKALGEIYIEKLQDEVSIITDSLNDEIIASQHVRDIPKSNSEMGRLGQIRGTLRRQHSKSMDSLIERGTHGGSRGSGSSRNSMGEHQQSSTEGIQYLSSVCQLVHCLLAVENYVLRLHEAIAWEKLPSTLRKSTSKTAIKGVLKTSQPTGVKRMFSPRSFEKSGLMPDEMPSPYGSTENNHEQSNLKVVESLSQEDKLDWDWRQQFAKLTSDMAKCIELQLHHACETCVNLLPTSNAESMDMTNVDAELVGGRLDYPKQTAKGTVTFVAHLEYLSILAQVSTEGPFHIVRSAYVDASCLALKNLLHSLNKLGSERSTDISLDHLYRVMATTAYVRNYLVYLDNVAAFEESSKKPFVSIYRQYCELVDSLSRQIVEHCVQVISTSILHDAESHYWQDPKDFYEDERCSFSLQMWHFYMCGLQHDMWRMCPPKLSQSILSSVLHDSVVLLTRRYCNAKPSYRRTPQYRRDILTLLLLISEHLQYCCNSPLSYMDTSLPQQPAYTIHNHCSSLLAASAVVTAPIDILYKVFKKGFNKKKSLSEEDQIKGYCSHWLSWIRPNLFPLGQTRYEQLQTTGALYIQLQLLLKQPEINKVLLLQAILMKEATLPIMILTRVGQSMTPASTMRQSSIMSTDTDDVSEFQQPAPASCNKRESDECQIFQVFVDVLYQFDTTPEVLAQVIIPVFDRTDTWNLMSSHAVFGSNCIMPAWLDVVLNKLAPFILRLIKPAVCHLLRNQLDDTYPLPSLSEFLGVLPCGCYPISDSNSENEQSAEAKVMVESLRMLITQLVEDVYMLPSQFGYLFKMMESRLDDLNIKTPHNCAGLKLVATVIRQTLADQVKMSQLIGTQLSNANKDSLLMLSECIYHLLTATNFGKNSGTPRMAGQFMKKNKSWLVHSIEAISEHFNSSVFERTGSITLDSTSQEFIENMLITVVSSVLSTNTGLNSMTKIYNLLHNNAVWLTEQLDIPSLFTNNENLGSSYRTHTEFKADTTTPVAKKFNPLHQFCHIGVSIFDLHAVDNFNMNWALLLQSDLGLTDCGFRNLLSNRHELQEGAYLEEHEKKAVQTLRARYELDSPGLS